MAIAWEQRKRIPRAVAFVMDALAHPDAAACLLSALGDRESEEALDFCDRSQLTLFLADAFPNRLRSRVEPSLAGNTLRVERVRQTYRQIAERLRSAGLEFVVLKGFTQWPHYVADLRRRVQYDLDLYLPPPDVARAREVLVELGYEPLPGFDAFPIDHLPTMIRKTGWQWRGDFFDPDIPVSVDLHFRFWDPETERFDAPGLEPFWARRSERLIDGLAVPVLDDADALAYTCLHLLRHFLRASLRAGHVYELAYFLTAHAENGGFWERWRELHPERLRQLQAVCFRLAAEWFDCRLSPVAEAGVAQLPAHVRLWFERYAASPLEAMFRPNKDEIWLNLCLLDSKAGAWEMLLRRLLPMRRPGPVDAVLVPDEQMTPWLRVRKHTKYAAYVAQRAFHHGALLVPTLWRGAGWWAATHARGPFWIFLAATSLLNLGAFLFYVLYNLYLLELGFREDFLGLVTGVMAAGTAAGALAAGGLAPRLGLAMTLRLCFLGMAVTMLVRSVATNQAVLLAFAALGGMAMSMLAVCLTPTVARLTAQETRPFAYSMVASVGIGLGVFAGLLSGPLAAWIGSLRGALLAASVLVALGLWPLAAVAIPADNPGGRIRYPRSRFLVRFLAAIAVWNLATGSFNSFFNAYFSQRMHMAVEKIGLVFSASQLAQVAAILLSPLVLKRLGLAGGISSMQAATAVALLCLAVSPDAAAASAAYTGYMAFQYMSDPGINSLLMAHVPESEQSGASALNFLVVFSGQAAAAALAGVAFARVGYPPVLSAAAAVALIAALLFRLLK